MKKLVSIFLSVCLLLSFVRYPCARAQEDPFGMFEDAINLMRWHAPFWDVPEGESFPVASIMQYTRQHFFTDAYGGLKITVGSYTFFATYVVPAEEFESAAQDFFAVVNIESLRSYTSFFWDYENDTGIDGFQHYQSDIQAYVFSAPGGMGDSSRYEIVGYTQENGLYTVYSHFLTKLGGEARGVEGEDYVQIGEDLFEVQSYLCAVMSVSNGRARFHSWQELQALPDTELLRPMQTLLETDTLSLEAERGVFPADAQFQVLTPDEEVLQTIGKALEPRVSDLVAYDIRTTVQPDGTVRATFVIPEGWDLDTVALFYILQEGEPQQLEVVVDGEAGFLTVQLTYFGVYVLAQLRAEEPLYGDANGDGAVNARDARLVLRYAAGLVEESELDMTLADANGDGKVNARDARRILQKAAGLME